MWTQAHSRRNPRVHSNVCLPEPRQFRCDAPNDATCQFRTHALQQTAPSFDPLVGANDQRDDDHLCPGTCSRYPTRFSRVRATQRSAIAIEHERKRCSSRDRAATIGRAARPKELRLPTRCFEQPPARPRCASCRNWVVSGQSRPRPRESQRLPSRIRLAEASAANPPRQGRNS